MSKKPAAVLPALEDNKNVLRVTTQPGVSEERQLANLATDGIATNAMTARFFLAPSQPNLSITEMVASLKDHGQRVNANDLAAPEQMLAAQAIALNAIFTELARRSAMNIGEYLDASERYMRLALKAQGQCRATVETLAAMKNPPVVFAKQANITSGPQQVNNGVMSAPNGEQKLPPAHGESETEQTKLLEGVKHGGTVLDAGATGATARGRQVVEAVGAIHRPQKPRRQNDG